MRIAARLAGAKLAFFSDLGPAGGTPNFQCLLLRDLHRPIMRVSELRSWSILTSVSQRETRFNHLSWPLRRNLRTLPAGFGKSNGDRLFAGRHLPPLPSLPERSVPRFSRRTVLSTLLLATSRPLKVELREQVAVTTTSQHESARAEKLGLHGCVIGEVLWKSTAFGRARL